MKSIVIASNTSGGGKTTVTLGLMNALKNRGFEVQGYKVGPDYIDAAFHTRVTGLPSRNLDSFLMGEDGVKAAYSRGVADYGVVEGVMGLYDGKGIDSEGSTAHIAKLLGLPIVLVLSPSSKVATLCAEINGLVDFENANIVGVILNNVSEGYYGLLKASIEKNCRIRVFGYLESSEKLELESRHLGLVQSSELENLMEIVNECSVLMEKNIKMQELLDCFITSEAFSDNFHYKNIGLKIGVAKDSAFSFYYHEAIELLMELGEVKFFSPLCDEKLPEGIDFLYLGGGYPELFLEKLTTNHTLRQDILGKLTNGLRCYAECGGLMYLTEKIDDYDMIGFFKGEAYLTGQLQNFGYSSLEVMDENSIFTKGTRINAHEFHTSFVESGEKMIYKLTKETYEGQQKTWRCGYIKNNTVGGYPHIHFWGNIEFLGSILGIPLQRK